MTLSNRRVRDSVPPPSAPAELFPAPSVPVPPAAAALERKPPQWLSVARTVTGVALVVARLGRRRLGRPAPRHHEPPLRRHRRRGEPGAIAAPPTPSSPRAGSRSGRTSSAHRPRRGACPCYCWPIRGSPTRPSPVACPAPSSSTSPSASRRRWSPWATYGWPSAEGEAFKRIDPGDPVDLPFVTEIRPETLADDRRGIALYARSTGAIDLAAEYDHGGLGRRLPLKEVHVQPDGGFALVVGRSAMEARAPEGPVPAQARSGDPRGCRGSRGRCQGRHHHAQPATPRPERVVVRMR